MNGTEEDRRKSLSEITGLPPLGIRCTSCGASGEWSVCYTRPTAEGVRRVRICRQCGHRIVTLERQAGSATEE